MVELSCSTAPVCSIAPAKLSQHQASSTRQEPELEPEPELGWWEPSGTAGQARAHSGLRMMYGLQISETPISIMAKGLHIGFCLVLRTLPYN